jgi:aspartyl-tRNA(Asn)/glutamyl-tRNA(Gln) amidotransferase subunit C
MSDSQKVTQADVLKIAELARLTLSDEELPVFTEQFNKILNHMDQLNEVDTDGVEPLSHVLDLVNATREDEPEKSLDQETVLNLAPKSKNGHIAVPPVIQKSDKESPK